MEGQTMRSITGSFAVEASALADKLGFHCAHDDDTRSYSMMTLDVVDFYLRARTPDELFRLGNLLITHGEEWQRQIDNES
jgi:hypothetical protein